MDRCHCVSSAAAVYRSHEIVDVSVCVIQSQLRAFAKCVQSLEFPPPKRLVSRTCVDILPQVGCVGNRGAHRNVAVNRGLRCAKQQVSDRLETFDR